MLENKPHEKLVRFSDMTWSHIAAHLSFGGHFECEEGGALMRARGVMGEPGFYILTRTEGQSGAKSALVASSISELIHYMQANSSDGLMLGWVVGSSSSGEG